VQASQVDASTVAAAGVDAVEAAAAAVAVAVRLFERESAEAISLTLFRTLFELHSSAAKLRRVGQGLENKPRQQQPVHCSSQRPPTVIVHTDGPDALEGAFHTSQLQKDRPCDGVRILIGGQQFEIGRSVPVMVGLAKADVVACEARSLMAHLSQPRLRGSRLLARFVRWRDVVCGVEGVEGIERIPWLWVWLQLVSFERLTRPRSALCARGDEGVKAVQIGV